MNNALRTTEPNTPHPPSTAAKRPFAPPMLERLGAFAAVTQGPGMGTEDAVIFAPGGDPSDDPS